MTDTLEVLGKGGTHDVDSLDVQAMWMPGVLCMCPGNVR